MLPGVTTASDDPAKAGALKTAHATAAKPPVRQTRAKRGV